MAINLDMLNPFKEMTRKTGLEGVEGLYDIPLPELEDLVLEDAVYAGDVDPQGDIGWNNSEYGDINSAFDGLQIDPTGHNSQLASMGALQDIIDRGGMSLADAANMNKVQTDVATADRGRRDAILQNMQARGMSGSGMELLAQLDSSQAATDRAAQAGMDQAGMMQQRALDSIMNRGQIGRQMTSDRFGMDSQIAQSQDAISQFNARNSLQNQQFNAQNQYNANTANRDYRTGIQDRNLDARQANTNQNVQTRNTAAGHNAGYNQQQFQNQMGVADGKAGARTAQAAAAQAERDRDEKRRGTILSGMGTVGAAFAGGK